MFSNSQTHFFGLSDPYKVCHENFVSIKNKLEPKAPMQVSSRQLYWWEEEDVPIGLQLEKDNYSLLFALCKDGIPAVKIKISCGLLLWEV